MPSYYKVPKKRKDKSSDSEPARGEVDKVPVSNQLLLTEKSSVSGRRRRRR
jgi:hypothetical protein